MENRRIDWDWDKYFTAYQVRFMYLKNYNNLLTSGRSSTKDPKDSQILALVLVSQKLAYDSKK